MEHILNRMLILVANSEWDTEPICTCEWESAEIHVLPQLVGQTRWSEGKLIAGWTVLPSLMPGFPAMLLVQTMKLAQLSFSVMHSGQQPQCNTEKHRNKRGTGLSRLNHGDQAFSEHLWTLVQKAGFFPAASCHRLGSLGATRPLSS